MTSLRPVVCGGPGEAADARLCEEEERLRKMLGMLGGEVGKGKVGMKVGLLDLGWLEVDDDQTGTRVGVFGGRLWRERRWVGVRVVRGW